MSIKPGKQGVAPTVVEKQEIALLKAAGHSHAEIARRMGRTRECVISALRCKEVQSLKDRARMILLDWVPQFARDWREAARVGAERGRHEPSRDALLHLGVVEPVTQIGAAVQVNVGVVAPGCPSPQGDTRAVLIPPPKPTPDGDWRRAPGSGCQCFARNSCTSRSNKSGCSRLIMCATFGMPRFSAPGILRARVWASS